MGSCEYQFLSLWFDLTGHRTPSLPLQKQTFYPLGHLIGFSLIIVKIVIMALLVTHGSFLLQYNRYIGLTVMTQVLVSEQVTEKLPLITSSRQDNDHTVGCHIQSPRIVWFVFSISCALVFFPNRQFAFKAITMSVCKYQIINH